MKFVKSRLKIAGKQPLGSRDRTTSNHSTRISSPRSTLANVVQPPSKSSVKEKTNSSGKYKLSSLQNYSARNAHIFYVHPSSNFFQRMETKNRNFFQYQFHPPSQFNDSLRRGVNRSQVETIKIGPVSSSTLFQPLIPFECQSLPSLPSSLLL